MAVHIISYEVSLVQVRYGKAWLGQVNSGCVRYVLVSVGFIKLCHVKQVSRC